MRVNPHTPYAPPVIALGVEGTGLRVTLTFCVKGLDPQGLTDVTETTPEVNVDPTLMVIAELPEPLMIVHPFGTFQLYDVVFAVDEVE